MKLVNPIGRTVSLGVEDNISPRACMCSIAGDNFAGARGTNDSCFHCGCDCTSSSGTRSGNKNGAFSSPWKSK